MFEEGSIGMTIVWLVVLASFCALVFAGLREGSKRERREAQAVEQALRDTAPLIQPEPIKRSWHSFPSVLIPLTLLYITTAITFALLGHATVAGTENPPAALGPALLFCGIGVARAISSLSKKRDWAGGYNAAFLSNGQIAVRILAQLGVIAIGGFVLGRSL
jgi:hypothetical protein